MTIVENLQSLKDFIDTNPFNLTDIDLEKLSEQYNSMKEKYGV